MPGMQKADARQYLLQARQELQGHVTGRKARVLGRAVESSVIALQRKKSPPWRSSIEPSPTIQLASVRGGEFVYRETSAADQSQRRLPMK